MTEAADHYKFFQHRRCEYFPCHEGAEEETFNCLFCYCPLYALADQCGGRYRYTETGIKDCTECLLPHSPGGYDHIMKQFSRLALLARRKEEQDGPPAKQP